MVADLRGVHARVAEHRDQKSGGVSPVTVPTSGVSTREVGLQDSADSLCINKIQAG
jgi:hypothetical protein